MTKLTLLKDDPERAALMGGNDLLGQDAAVDTLMTSIESLPAPACIALYGSWGSGKSTLMYKAKKRWTDGPDGEQKRRSIWFDPWEYERSGDLLTPLLYALVEEVRGDGRLDADAVKDLLVGAAKVLLALSVRLGVAAASGGLVNLPADSISFLKDLKPEKLAELFDERAKLHDEVKHVKARFKELVDKTLQGRSGPLVFFLDDLDRCLPDSTVTLIEAVKLLLCGDTGCKAVFVFALDRQIVGEAIRHRYPGSASYTGENYLEKIFDLSLEVPPIREDDIEAFIQSVFAQTTEPMEWMNEAFGAKGMTGLANIRDVLAQPFFANPRVIQRTLNRMALLLQDEKRRRVLGAVADWECLNRFIAWTAGTERFREFRHFFFTTTDIERATLHAAMCQAEGKATLPSRPTQNELASIATQPGFRGYYDFLIVANQATRYEEQLPPTGGLKTLRDFDDLLRSAGL